MQFVFHVIGKADVCSGSCLRDLALAGMTISYLDACMSGWCCLLPLKNCQKQGCFCQSLQGRIYGDFEKEAGNTSN